MGLYSTFNTSDYYDDEPKKQAPNTPVSTPSTQVPQMEIPKIPEAKRQSLYDQAKEVASTKTEYTGPDFRDIYRPGQTVSVQGANGDFRTQKGVVAEVVARNLMYVYMEDSYKDATDQWLADFVTDKDTVTFI